MEILTIIKANLLKKKGTFISIIILILLITALMVSILSVKGNYNDGVDRAFNDNGDILVDIKRKNLSDELFSSVEAYKDVKKVEKYNTFTNRYSKYNGINDNNNYFFRELPDNVNVYNEKLNDFVKEDINKGEIFLPLGLKDKLKCELDKEIEIYFNDSIVKKFKIAAFVEEPHQGSSSIGWKQVFINQDDYNEIEGIIDEKLLYYTLEIYKNDDCNISSRKFQRDLNLVTNIISMADGSLNKDQSVYYSVLIPNIVINVAQAFSVLLFLIVIIIVNHSISTEFEMDYQTIGIYKALGYSKRKIRMIYFLQYFIAIIIGIVIGLLLALPLESLIGKVCHNITGIMPDRGIRLGVTLLYILIISLISGAVIYLKTIAINKISPIKAINGNNDDVYFGSRINAPISKKFLSLSLSFRQFSSAFKRYISIIIITIFLVFCMVTTTLVGNSLSSKETLRSMGVTEYDIFVSTKIDQYNYSKMDKYVESTNQMIEKNSYASAYVSIDGENSLCEFYEYPEYISGILKGRTVKYDNEIIVTKQLAKELNVKIGDKVNVAFGEKISEYIITGYYQTTSDAGYSFAMSIDGAIRNGATFNKMGRYYVIDDKDRIKEIADYLKDNFKDVDVFYDTNKESTSFESYKSVVDIINILIYSFSVIFTLVVIRMICIKAFIQEKTTIGIYKSLGFTNNKLRLQFSLRFLIVAFIGTTIGVILSILFSDDVLNLIFSMFGICKVSLKYTFTSVFIPFMVIAICLFIFSFIISRRIKKLEITSLIAEV